MPHLFKKNISRGKQLERFQIIFVHLFLCILFLVYLEKCFETNGGAGGEEMAKVMEKERSERQEGSRREGGS